VQVKDWFQRDFKVRIDVANVNEKNEKLAGELKNARFFVIKSFCEEDVHKVSTLYQEKVIMKLGDQI